MTKYYQYTLTIETLKRQEVADSHPHDREYEMVKGGYICQTTIAVSSTEHAIHNFQRQLAQDIYDDHCARDHENVQLLAWKAEQKKYISIIPIHTVSGL